MTIAVTGATGFVGGRLLGVAAEAGVDVRALTRQPRRPRAGVEWVEGSLEDPVALARLADGASAMVHIAGTINAPDSAGFEAGNVAGTAAALGASAGAGVPRFVHVSSLAAREPTLSHYGASKARSEALVTHSGLNHAIVRPPAVYGPGDRETLDLFRMARRGLLILPPPGRLSVIHADDLARLLLALAADNTESGRTYEPDDGCPGGWTHRAFGEALGAAVDRRPLVVHLPPAALRAGAALDRLFRRGGARLTPDRVAYFCHPDWVADSARSVPDAIWAPQIETRRGLAATADWYCSEGWL